MTLVIFIVFILLAFIYLLFAPIIVHVNTIDDLYYFQYSGLMKASVIADKEELVKIKLSVFFMSFDFYPLRKKKKSKKTNEITTNAKKKKKRIDLRTGFEVLKSFKVRRFFINIDTGDCVENAKIYPVFALLNYSYGGFNVNFENKNQLILELVNRPITIIKSFINN